ncbi:MAG: endonuclease/exonuclease/phosphatase family protein [Bacteroidota bacterium]
MKRLLKRLFRIVMYFIILILIAVGSFLIWLHLYSYKPATTENIEINGKGREYIFSDTLNICIWNIGYAGLGKEMDFFYEGGKAVRPDENSMKKYLDGILKTVKSYDSVEVFLFQEVDTYSKRSYKTDEAKSLASALPEFSSSFAINYQSAFVPQPLSEPYGKVNSGIMTFSATHPERSVRRAFPPEASFPMQYFMLDRCCMITTVPIMDGHKLIIVNTHNSAFDDGSKRKEQLNIIRQVLLEEYKKGNYVIAGGDWNQCPQNYTPTSDYYSLKVEKDFPAIGWTCAFDPSTPSNRNVDKPYQKGVTKTSVLDFFFLSPNIKLLQVKCSDAGFEFSDHNPVTIKIVLQ